MSLNKVNYVDGITVITAENLNEIQDEVIANAGKIETKASTASLAATDKQVSNIKSILKGELYRTEPAPSPSYSSLVPAGAQKYAELQELDGKSIVWNQRLYIIKNGYWNNINANITWIADGEAQVQKKTAGMGGIIYHPGSSLDITHKYYLAATVKSDDENPEPVNLGFLNATGSLGGNAYKSTNSKEYVKISLIASPVDKTNICAVRIGSSTSPLNASMHVKDIIMIDLTRMFGAGNEPTDSTVVDAMFPLNYYPHNAGELKSAKVNSVDTVGFNRWDEEWENGGINLSTGVNYATNLRLRSKNYIPVIPNTSYYFYSGNNISYQGIFYDKDKSFIGSTAAVSLNFAITNRVFTMPDRCCYMRFVTVADQSSQPSYNHDICLNISNASLNGTYKPYTPSSFPIPSSIELRSAGAVSDYIDFKERKLHRRIGVVDLGTFSWIKNGTNTQFYAPLAAIEKPLPLTENGITSNGYAVGVGAYQTKRDKSIELKTTNIWIWDNDYTATADFRTAMNGVKLYYELEEEKIIDLSDILSEDNFIEVQEGGTLTFTQDNGFALPVGNKVEYLIKLTEAN